MTKRGNTYKVKIESSTKDGPDSYEKIASRILAEYFQSDVIFIKNANISRPDLYVCKQNQYWEIKTPKGSGKNTFSHRLSKIEDQSENVVISLIRLRQPTRVSIGRIKAVLSKPNRIKRLIVITKDKKVLVIKGKT